MTQMGYLLKPRLARKAEPLAIYLSLVLLVFGFSLWRTRTPLPPTKSAQQTESNVEPYFSLNTNRTFAAGEQAQLWTTYQNISYLDFRVYHVKDANRFFKQLDNPHQIGNEEKAEVSRSYLHDASVLEATHSFKAYLNAAIKTYVREQLQREHREEFNQKFRPSYEPLRTPLNVADYARVPLLNPDQLASAWREKLPATESQYESRKISLGRRESGVYLVEAVNGDLRAYSIAIVTDLTMVQKTAPDGELLVYVVDRQTGAPHANVSVEVAQGQKSLISGSTDKSGLFQTSIHTEKIKVDGSENSEGEEMETRISYLVMAREGNNFVISDPDSFYYGGFGRDGDYDPNLVSYIYTERPVYRPQQKVYFKGILRRWTKHGYQLLNTQNVSVTITDAGNGKIFERELPLSPRGTFNGEVEIGEEAPLGSYEIVATTDGAKAISYFSVEEYKKPEFKVKVTGPNRFASAGEKVSFSIDARYFFGAPVAKADVHYYIYRSRYYHWWMQSDDDFDDGAGPDNEAEDDSDYGYYGNSLFAEDEGQLNAAGHFAVEFQVPEVDDKDEWDYSYTLQAQVTDSSRREMQGSASFVGTRGRVVADAHPERYLYYQGDSARIHVRTGDYMGKRVAQTVTLKFIEQHWERIEREEENNGYRYKTYDYVSHERELASTEVTTNSAGEAVYEYLVPAPGYIYLKTIIHENGRQVVSRGGFLWAPDRKGDWGGLIYGRGEEKAIKLVPDKKSYRPGETAHVLAMLPVEKTHLLVTVELSNVLSAKQVDAPGHSLIIDVPIEQGYAPNVYLTVSYVKNDDLFEQSQLLGVPARDRMLKIDILPNKKEYKPREAASYTILARNADGSPATNTEVSLGVVDEAIYSIQPESATNIKRDFYGRRFNEIETSLAIRYQFTGYAGDKPVDLAKTKASYQLADFKNENSLAEPTIRREFKDTALWQADLLTGSDGKATISFKLPDNLTTWRATARAVTADTRVGSAIAKVVARKDVIMRLEMPRFLTAGDTATISGVVHNFLNRPKNTHISLEVSGAQLLDEATQTITIPHNGEHRVDWRIKAQQPGDLRLLAKALTDKESDAVEMSMQIVPHGLKQTIGSSLAITNNDSDQTLSLNIPAHPDVQARKLRIEAAPSIAGTLFGALDYLTSFPYGCTEQTMSSFLPNVIVATALRDVQTARLRANNDLPKKVQRGLDRLYSYQHADGGWGWWKDDSTDAFMTAYVVDGLALANRAGFQTEEWRLERGREKLAALLEQNKSDDGNPIDAETRAFMIYALIESGNADSRYLEELYGQHTRLQPYGRALLALSLKQRGDNRMSDIAAEIEASANVNDFEAHWQTNRLNNYGHGVPLDIEATALSLKALAQISPRSSVLPKAARWLVKNRHNGYYWISTKETAFAVFGLTDYLKVSNELSPDFDLSVYVNGEEVLAKHVTSVDVEDAQSFTITRKASEVGSENEVRVVKRGRGALYVSTTLEYFSGEEEVQAQSSPELGLTREYLRLRIDQDAQGRPLWTIEPLVGDLHSGDLIVARLHASGARADYLMIEDPIPAGCEQVSRVENLTLGYASRWSEWYSAREFRDEKTVFFLNYFDGDATLQYAMRVQVPGDFRAAPARTELMYQPTVQANTNNTHLRILDKQ
jgi:alpha-2-macroglobulin